MAAAAGAAGAGGGPLLKSGQRILVQWRANEPWQARGLVAPVTTGEYEECAGEEAPEGAVQRVLIWYAVTPDGDIYPHCLPPPAVAGVVPCDATGQPNRALGMGARLPRGNPQIYGRQWQLDARQFLGALEFVTGEDYGEKIRDQCRRQEGRVQLLGSLVPSEWVGIADALPDPAPDKWVQVGSSDGAGRAVLRDLGVDYGVVCSGLAMCKKGEQTFIVKISSGGGAGLGARVLAVVEDADGGRHLPFRDATRLMTVTEWAKWPLQVNLTSADPAVAEHEFCMRVVQLAVHYDQLNISELAAFELVLR
ncbi:unnamed protein product, partial [Prorocentrum cordatum]